MKNCQMCERLHDEIEGLRKLVKLQDNEIEKLKEECQAEIRHNTVWKEAEKLVEEGN